MAYKLFMVILLIELATFFCNSEENQNNSLVAYDRRNIENEKLGVYNGINTTINRHPYVVGILLDETFNCAGAIISKRWVLTLADSIYSVDASRLTVVAGSEDGVSGTQHAVYQVVVHPNYGTSTLDSDYVLLQVTDRFTWSSVTRPVALPSYEPQGPVRMTVVGFGHTSSDRASSCLQQGRMTWLAKSTCESAYADLDITWTDRMACAFSYLKGTTLCQGDFGDPFVRNGKLYGFFIGGASVGFCSQNAKAVILADVYPVVDWITNTTESSS